MFPIPHGFLKGGSAAPPVGPYPVIEDFLWTVGTSSDFDLLVNAVPGIKVGEFLVILAFSSSATSGAKWDPYAGWNYGEHHNNSADAQIGWYSRVADGTEGPTELLPTFYPAWSAAAYFRISNSNNSLRQQIPSETTSTFATNRNVLGVTTLAEFSLALFGVAFEGDSGTPFSTGSLGFSIDGNANSAGGGSGVSACFGTKEMPIAEPSGTCIVASSTRGSSVHCMFEIQQPQPPAPPIPAIAGWQWTYDNSNSSSIVAIAPAAIGPGERLILAVNVNQSRTMNTPSGWTLINNGNSGGDTMYLFAKVATGSEGDVTITMNSGGIQSAYYMRVSGASASMLNDVSNVVTGSSTSSLTIPGVNSLVVDSLALSFAGMRGNTSPNILSGIGWVQTDAQDNLSAGQIFGEKDMPSIAPTEDVTITFNANNQGVGFIYVIEGSYT